MLTKPRHGQRCNGCGLCCLNEQCPLSLAVFGRQARCPALAPKGVILTCELVEMPANHVLPKVLQHGRKAVSDGAAVLIGAGVGCDACAEGEKRDVAFSLRLRKAYDAATVSAARKVWGV